MVMTHEVVSDSCYNFANGFAHFHQYELSQPSLSCGFYFRRLGGIYGQTCALKRFLN